MSDCSLEYPGLSGKFKLVVVPGCQIVNWCCRDNREITSKSWFQDVRLFIAIPRNMGIEQTVSWFQDVSLFTGVPGIIRTAQTSILFEMSNCSVGFQGNS